MIIDDLKALVDASGLVSDFVLTNFYDESKHTSKTVSFRINGGAGSDQYVRNPDVDFVFYGESKSNSTTIQSVGASAESLFSYFLDNYKQNCIIGISALSEVSGVYHTDSDRPFYTFSIRLKTGR